MTKREIKYLVNIAVIFAAMLVYFAMKLVPHQASATEQEKFIFVSKVIDGDTVKLSSGEHVRLIGIDTPESRHNNKLIRDSKRSGKNADTILRMGKEASNFTRGLVEGKRVKLEFDVQKQDKYGRLLAYLYLEGGTFVNAKIVEEGYARCMAVKPNVKYAQIFQKLENQARQKGKGLWKNISEDKMF